MRPLDTATRMAGRTLGRLWLMLGMALLSPETTPQPGHLNVDLVLSGNDPSYRAVAQGLLQRLDATPVGRRIRRHELVLDRYPANASTDASLVVAVGMRACERVAEKGPSPLFCIFIPERGFRALTRRLAGREFGALFIDQPIIRQFALARVLSPDAERVGLLAGEELLRQEAELRRSAKAMDFSLQLEPGEDVADAPRAIRRLLERVDAVVATFQPELLTASSARWLLQLAQYRRTPVIGYSEAYVKAGALAAVYSSPESIGEQAAGVISDWAARRPQSIIASQGSPRRFEVALNESVAISLGIEPRSSAGLAAQVAALVGRVR